MFKKLMVAISLIVVMFCMVACDLQATKYDYAVLYLPNGNSVEGWIDDWYTLGNGELIWVMIEGTGYRVHTSNVVMIDE